MSRTTAILRQLRRYESRNVTHFEADGSWPIVWERARGVHVWDADGKKYLDLTAAFGVAAAGHANPRVVRAGQRQMARLLHAMGDVHPPALKAQLARALSRLTFERWHDAKFKAQSSKHKGRARYGKTIFGSSGFEAVEAALKTAMLATGRRGVIAFTGAYHGLGYGALNATHRAHFRARFAAQLGGFVEFAPYPSAEGGLAETETALRHCFRGKKIGAVLVEPVQGRGGINVPPPEFLPLLRQLCDEHGALLIVDEILTGFGRTGRWFACEHTRTVPDVICLGKALAGGFPISACVGRADVMDAAWPASNGEAIRTSTFLGHPVGCAMALAQIAELETGRLVSHSARLGATLLAKLSTLDLPAALRTSARGLGLMAGLELCRRDGAPATDAALRAVKLMLHRGFTVLPEGEHANVLSFTPPLTITERQLQSALATLSQVLTMVVHP